MQVLKALGGYVVVLIALSGCAALPSYPVREGAADSRPYSKPPALPVTSPKDIDWRTPDPQTILIIDTNRGQVIVELVPQAAPEHVARIVALTRKGVYDKRTFFRVIDRFMAQTGDPLNTGIGPSGPRGGVDRLPAGGQPGHQLSHHDQRRKGCGLGHLLPWRGRHGPR
jgi:hypothetical protein